MNGTRRHAAVVGAMAIWALLVTAGLSQPKPSPGGAATKPVATRAAPRIKQPPELLALAAKARKLKAAHVTGSVTIEGDLPAGQTGEKVTFNVWVEGAKARLSVNPPVGEQRVTDGKFAYIFRRAGKARAIGVRRRMTAANTYNSLAVAAIVRDAMSGYADLANGVKFVPVPPEPDHARRFGKLKWFRLDAVGKPVHPVLASADSRTVTMGLSPADGLARVMIGRLRKGGKLIFEVIHYQTVKPGPVKADDLKFTPEAADAAWSDADKDGNRILPPTVVIAEPKPKPKP